MCPLLIINTIEEISITIGIKYAVIPNSAKKAFLINTPITPEGFIYMLNPTSIENASKNSPLVSVLNLLVFDVEPPFLLLPAFLGK